MPIRINRSAERVYLRPLTPTYLVKTFPTRQNYDANGNINILKRHRVNTLIEGLIFVIYNNCNHLEILTMLTEPQTARCSTAKNLIKTQQINQALHPCIKIAKFVPVKKTTNP